MSASSPWLPLVSILIPTYNQEALVGDAVRSALAQDYANLEVIVADDASGDRTADVVARFLGDRRLQYCRHDRNRGRVANYRHALLHLAVGDWALVLDGDDYLTDSGYVSTAIDEVARHDDIVLVVAGEEREESGKLVHRRLPTADDWRVMSGFDFLLQWRFDSVVPHFAAICNRRLASSIGFYTEDILSSDWESLRRLALHGNVLLAGRHVGVWRGHGANASRTLDVAAHWQNLRSVTGPVEHGLNLGVSRDRLEAWQETALADYTVNFVSAAVADDQPRIAQDFLALLAAGYPASHRRAIRSLATSPRFWVKCVARRRGRNLVQRLRAAWRSGPGR